MQARYYFYRHANNSAFVPGFSQRVSDRLISVYYDHSPQTLPHNWLSTRKPYFYGWQWDMWWFRRRGTSGLLKPRLFLAKIVGPSKASKHYSEMEHQSRKRDAFSEKRQQMWFTEGFGKNFLWREWCWGCGSTEGVGLPIGFKTKTELLERNLQRRNKRSQITGQKRPVIGHCWV